MSLTLPSVERTSGSLGEPFLGFEHFRVTRFHRVRPVDARHEQRTDPIRDFFLCLLRWLGVRYRVADVPVSVSSAFWRWWGPLGLYMALIFFVSSRPRPAGLNQAPDLLLHGGAYFVMALLAVRALAKGLRERASLTALCGGSALAILYGATDELHQSRVAERVGSWADLLYDGVGAVMAGAALSVFWKVQGDRR